jgi:hypothetical protein
MNVNVVLSIGIEEFVPTTISSSKKKGDEHGHRKGNGLSTRNMDKHE